MNHCEINTATYLVEFVDVKGENFRESFAHFEHMHVMGGHRVLELQGRVRFLTRPSLQSSHRHRDCLVLELSCLGIEKCTTDHGSSLRTWLANADRYRTFDSLNACYFCLNIFNGRFWAPSLVISSRQITFLGGRVSSCRCATVYNNWRGTTHGLARLRGCRSSHDWLFDWFTRYFKFLTSLLFLLFKVMMNDL